jgi:hypothetical protein
MPEPDREAEERLKRQLAEHSGYLRHRELDAFATSIGHVFRSNFLELLGHLQTPEIDFRLASELVQNVRAPTVRDAYIGELSRKLHNYLASAHSVVDHSRRLLRDAGSEVATEWGTRLSDAQQEHPVVHFMQGLRNYALHRNVPFFGSSMTMTRQEDDSFDIVSEIRMSVYDLREWDDWSSSAKAFLDTLDSSFPLRPLVDEHGPVIYDLNHWLHGALANENAPLLEEANELIVAANAARFGVDAETARRLAQRDGEMGGL